MTIRGKLILSTFLLQVSSMALLGGGVLIIRRQFQERDIASAAALIEASVRRAASDFLIQKDDVGLLSYMKFLQGEFPAIVQARVLWRSGERERTATVGDAAPGSGATETRVAVADSADPARSVEVALYLDPVALERPFWEESRRLSRIILSVWAGTCALGLVVSILLARSLTRPIVELSRLARNIGDGKLGGHLSWRSDDELGGLVSAFNAMSARLEELDTIKRNFVSSVTHELRSPLGAIESFLQLIQDKLASGRPESLAQCAQFLDRIRVNVRRLSGFINDVLDVSKIEKGKMECVLRPMALQPVADEVCQFFEAKAQQQGVAISAEMPSLPAIAGDADRLRQVLVNLVANGLKFTPRGGKLLVSAEQVRDGGARWVEVTVADTGRGMDPADCARLFQPFSQGRNNAHGAASHRGTGLGLYIAKSIVDQHGGRIEAESLPGRGTKIRFSLKVAA